MIMDSYTWEEYYEKIWEWQPSTMVKHMSKLSSFGPSEEVMEAIIEISFGDQKGATRMLKKAMDAGVKFNGDQLSNMYGNCDESELERALRFSADQFTTQDIDDLYGVYEDALLIEIALKHNIAIPEELAEENEEFIVRKAVLAAQHRLDDEILEELYGVVEDSLIKQVAGKNGLKLPECLREDDTWCVSEQQDRDAEKLSKDELYEAYEYVLQCLSNAHEKMVLAYRLSISDVGNDKRSISIIKHACLLEAEPFVAEARLTLEEIESQVQDKISVQNTRLNMGKWIVFHDVYGDGFLTDWMVQLRIKKMIRAVEDAHKEVLKLKSKL